MCFIYLIYLHLLVCTFSAGTAVELLRGNPTSGKDAHRLAHLVIQTLAEFDSDSRWPPVNPKAVWKPQASFSPHCLNKGNRPLFNPASYNQEKTQKSGFPAKLPFFRARQVETTLCYRCVHGEKWYIIWILFQMDLENLLYKKALQGTHKNTNFFVHVSYSQFYFYLLILSAPQVHRIELNYSCPLSPAALAASLVYFHVLFFSFSSHPYCCSSPEWYSH